MWDRSEDSHGMLGFHRWRVLELVRAIFQFLVRILHETQASRRTKLQEVAQMDDDGNATEVVMSEFVGRLDNIPIQTSTTHGAKVQHVVKLRRHHTHLLNDESAHLAPERLELAQVRSWPHPVIEQLLHTHSACCMQSACLHINSRNIFRLRIGRGAHHQRGFLNGGWWPNIKNGSEHDVLNSMRFSRAPLTKEKNVVYFPVLGRFAGYFTGPNIIASCCKTCDKTLLVES